MARTKHYLILNKTLSLFCLVAFAPAIFAQQGLPPEWESRQLAQSVVDSTQRLNPVLTQINPLEWIKNGAPEAYTRQLQSIQTGVRYISISAKQFSTDPQKLSAALDTYLRVQWLETQIGSLEQGVRKYQNSALADLLVTAVSENASARTQLQQYILDLANYRETEMSVMSKEAQQCRSSIARGQAKPKEKITK